MESLDDKTVKIVSPERIARILNKLCSSKVQALIRVKDDPALGIRGTFHIVDVVDGSGFVCLNEISVRGMEKLAQTDEVKVDVLGMPSRVVFSSSIARIADRAVYLPLPKYLASTERRKNARYPTTMRQMAFVQFSAWSADKEDVMSSPMLPPYESLASWIPVADMSAGGICLLTGFPSLISIAQQGKLDEKAKLILPASAPIELPMEFRWTKRTIQRLKVNSDEQSQIQYRFGIEFREMSEHAKVRIRQFMRQLVMSEAI
ncbi:MAG: hypothetical protein AB7T49_00165 [Oligoflexales bacterium]